MKTVHERFGQLEVMLALEIATQVASGLAAVYKQKLVLRDVKPSTTTGDQIELLLHFTQYGATMSSINSRMQK
jgi:hypothetical protein